MNMHGCYGLEQDDSPSPADRQAAALERLASEWEARHKIPVDVVIQLSDRLPGEVENDGVGFEVNTNHGERHLGLLGMRERAGILFLREVVIIYPHAVAP